MRRQHTFSTMSASLAAASFIAITQILTAPRDCTLLIAVWIFAFCPPLLVKIALDSPVKRMVRFDKLTTEEQRAAAWCLYVLLMDIAGFAFVFFHFGKISGIIFVISCLLALGVITEWKSILRIATYPIFYPVIFLQAELGKIRER